MSNEREDLLRALRLLLPYRTDSDGIDEAISYIEARIQKLLGEELALENE